jgi:hypothetical protein
LRAIAADNAATLALSGLGEGDQQWLNAKRDWAQDKLRDHNVLMEAASFAGDAADQRSHRLACPQKSCLG